VVVPHRLPRGGDDVDHGLGDLATAAPVDADVGGDGAAPLRRGVPRHRHAEAQPRPAGRWRLTRRGGRLRAPPWGQSKRGLDALRHVAVVAHLELDVELTTRTRRAGVGHQRRPARVDAVVDRPVDQVAVDLDLLLEAGAVAQQLLASDAKLPMWPGAMTSGR